MEEYTLAEDQRGGPNEAADVSGSQNSELAGELTMECGTFWFKCIQSHRNLRECPQVAQMRAERGWTPRTVRQKCERFSNTHYR